MNEIVDKRLHLRSAQIQMNASGTQMCLIIRDEYIRALGFQKHLREDLTFFVSGDLLYALMAELMDHINRIFMKIRLTDVEVDDENKTMLFLRKFSRSSELIYNKLSVIQSRKDIKPKAEVFEFPIRGMEGQLGFTRDQNSNSKLVIGIPVNYVYNRLISMIDKMIFSELTLIDEKIRNAFLNGFKELNSNVEDKKKQIDMKYALELAKERIQALERDNFRQRDQINQLTTQNDLYKRSYFSLRKRKKGKDSDSKEELNLLESMDD